VLGYAYNYKKGKECVGVGYGCGQEGRLEVFSCNQRCVFSCCLWWGDISALALFQIVSFLRLLKAAACCYCDYFDSASSGHHSTRGEFVMDGFA
jgi:hypothetical protein